MRGQRRNPRLNTISDATHAPPSVSTTIAQCGIFPSPKGRKMSEFPWTTCEHHQPDSTTWTRELRVRSHFTALGNDQAMPSSSSAPLRAVPSQWKVDTRVVSTASCMPPNRGRPSSTTSRRRVSLFGTPKSRSRIRTLVVTRTPASRQIRAVAV